MVAQVIHRSAEEGRLDLDEVSHRLGVVYAAKTYRDLESVLADLPPAALPPALRTTPPVGPRHPPGVPAVPPEVSTAAEMAPVSGMARVVARPPAGHTGPTSSVAVFSEAKRDGVWTVPESYSAVAVFGSAKVDLREVWLETAEPYIQASAVLGEVEIVVPDDIRVVCDGVGVLGEFDGSQEQGTGQPTLRVSGVAILGQVTVKRKRRRGAR